MKKEIQTIKCTSSKPRTNRRGSLVLATVAGVALVAVGCSSTSTNSQPAAGGAQTPGGQSSGYVTSSTITTTTAQRTDVITDPGTLPRQNIWAEFDGRPVNFTHMKVQRVSSDGFIEVTSDAGTPFYVIGYESPYNVKPGDIVDVTGTIVDPDSVSTAMDKKTGYYMMRHPYYIRVERIQIAPA